MFWAAKLTKDADPHNCKYSGVGFDARESFPSSDGSMFGENVIIFGVYMSLSVPIDNKKKYINGWFRIFYKSSWATEKNLFKFAL